jgi:PIN domain nuclease of toxin-antitoxin system
MLLRWLRPLGTRLPYRPISLAEIVYLVEKNRLPPDVYGEVRTALHDGEHVFKEAPLTIEVVEAMWEISRTDIADMPDRIIAAMARHLGVPIISRDGRIRAAVLQTIW